MNWELTTIGEHCTVTSSKRFHLSERCKDGIPFYCSKEIIQKVNGQEVTDCDYISEEVYEQVKKQFGVPETGDLLITTRGTYGIPYIYSKTDRFYFADGNLTWLKEFDKYLLPQYLYFWVLSYEGQKKIDAIAKGTAQKAVPIASIKSISLRLPCIRIQQKIVDILSAYDDLIENNRKQIKLLEEAAQRLYKEWFVDLHFPGWETTEVVDGVPVGWKTSSINELGHFVRGKTITKSDVNEGDVPVVAGGIEPAYYHNVSNTEMPVITISGSGANAGFTRIYFQKIWASDCSYVDSTGSRYIYFVYCFLKNSSDAIKKLQKGSAQPHVYAKDINALTVTIPNMKMLRSFEEHIRPCFNATANCNKIIMSATEARDRLLPKLMSGELEV